MAVSNVTNNYITQSIGSYVVGRDGQSVGDVSPDTKVESQNTNVTYSFDTKRSKAAVVAGIVILVVSSMITVILTPSLSELGKQLQTKVFEQSQKN